MDDCKKEKQRKQAACILCTIFLVFLLILLLILYFTVFKPKDPAVQVSGMQLLSLTTMPNYSALNNLSLSLQVSMYNPNRADFYIEDGSLACLYFQGFQIASTPTPAGVLFSQSSTMLSLTINLETPIQLSGLQSNPSSPSFAHTYNYAPPPPPYAPYSIASPNILPLSTSILVRGHVTTASMFPHHSDVVSKCNLILYLADPGGQIQSYSCLKSYSQDD